MLLHLLPIAACPARDEAFQTQSVRDKEVEQKFLGELTFEYDKRRFCQPRRGILRDFPCRQEKEGVAPLQYVVGHFSVTRFLYYPGVVYAPGPDVFQVYAGQAQQAPADGHT